LAISRDGRLVAGLSRDAALALWDFASGRRIAHIPNVMERIWAAEIEFSPDGRYLAISSEISKMIRIWRIARR
jgi:WD40 repeat protein